MRTFSFDTEREHDVYGTVTVYATGTISQYYPATFYRSNGDPGDPAEGGDVEYDELYAVIESGEIIDWESDDDLDALAEEKADDGYVDDFDNYDDYE